MKTTESGELTYELAKERADEVVANSNVSWLPVVVAEAILDAYFIGVQHGIKALEERLK